MCVRQWAIEAKTACINVVVLIRIALEAIEEGVVGETLLDALCR